MQRIIVMGPPGSGKSTLARRLGEARSLPVFHLDQIYHLPGWVARPTDAFRADVERIAALPAWVIDGNYIGAMAPRLAAADTLIFLDIPTRLRMTRIIRRIVALWGRVRPDSAEGCPERLDWTFLAYAWRWNRDNRARNMAVVRDFGGRTIMLDGARAQREFLSGLPRI